MISFLQKCTSSSIVSAAFFVAVSSVLSRLLGVFRDRILASEFGAGDALDAYYAAFRIPDFIFNILVLGALSAGFIPIFTELSKGGIKRIMNRNQDSAWHLANNVLNSLLIVSSSLAILGAFFAPELTRLISPGFSTEKQELTATLSRIMFLSPIILGLSGVIGSILQARKNFFVYSLSPIFYNIGIIIGALILFPRWGLTGLAWGVVAGALMHLLIQVPSLIALGWRPMPVFDLNDKDFRKIIGLMAPRTLSLGIAQINLFVTTIIASTLSSGALSVFTLANNLQSFPVAVFGISIAVAAFPSLSEHSNSKKSFLEDFSWSFRQMLFFVVPSTVIFLSLRAQIIRLVLGAGQFGWSDTVLTMQALGFFSLSLFSQSAVHLLSRSFYARRDTKTPFFIGVIVSVINIILAYYFSQSLGAPGLALAFSISSILNFSLLWVTLRTHFETLDEMRILISAVKFTSASIAAGIFIQLSKIAVANLVDMDRTFGVFIQTAVAASSGLIAYFLICYFLKCEELYCLLDSLKRRINFAKKEPLDQSEVRGI